MYFTNSTNRIYTKPTMYIFVSIYIMHKWGYKYVFILGELNGRRIIIKHTYLSLMDCLQIGLGLKHIKALLAH